MNTTDYLRQNVGIFKEFSAERLQELVNGSRVGSFEANEAIIHQGQEATHFGVVLSGTVSVSVLGDGNVRQSLGQLAAGETFRTLSNGSSAKPPHTAIPAAAV